MSWLQMHCRDKYSQHNSIIWPLWPNGWIFVYELNGCEFESRWSHLNFRYCACLDQGVTSHSGNHRVCIYSETRTWHDKNTQWNGPYWEVLRTQLNHLTSLPKWLSLCLGTKSLWVLFVYRLNGGRFESRCSHLNFRCRVCLEQGVPWDSGNHRVRIHSETCTSLDKNVQSNAPYR